MKDAFKATLQAHAKKMLYCYNTIVDDCVMDALEHTFLVNLWLKKTTDVLPYKFYSVFGHMKSEMQIVN